MGRFQLPDDDAMQSDVTTPGYKYDSSGRLLLESKIDIRKRGCPSPDIGDAIALTFSEADGYRVTSAFRRNLRDSYAKQGIYV